MKRLGRILKNQNSWFWILQFTGWGFLTIFLIFIDDETSLLYKVMQSSTDIISSITATSLLRFYLKKNKNEYKKVYQQILLILVCIISSALFLIILDYCLDITLDKLFPFLHESHKLNDHQESKIEFWGLTYIGTLIIVFIWTCAYLTIKIILRQNKDKLGRLKLDADLREAQLNTLKGQINPHFMFNSLNNIRGLMLEDVHKSREMITKLAEMLRYSLTKSYNDVIALEEELEIVDNYVALAKIQMEDRLSFQKNIDENLRTYKIPPMIIQLLVENAVKHGIAKQKNGGVVALSVLSSATTFTIEIKNTGKLTIDENSTQLGLENIKKRLQIVYGKMATFSLKEEKDEVIATIKIYS